MASGEILLSALLVKYSVKYMRSKKTGTSTSRVKRFLTDKLPKYAESLSSYISACQEDPDLKSFDSSLAGQGDKTENSSLDSLNEVCEFLVGLRQYVTKNIIDNNEHVSKNEELKSMVGLYFESTTKTLNLFNKMKKKYAQTLEELNKVKAMEDPFGDEFATQYESVYKEQVMLLDKIRELRVVLEKKHKNVKKWRTLGYIFFAIALFSFVAISLLASSSPPTATVAIAFTPMVATAGGSVIEMLKRLIEMLKDYEKSVKTQKDLFLLTENSTKVNIQAMQEIITKVEGFAEKIEEV